MILEINDYDTKEQLGAINLTENNSNGELEIVNTKGNIYIYDSYLDDIFGTNDNKIKIFLRNDKGFKRDRIANSIVDDILSTREGEIYDEEILDMFTTDYFIDEMSKIKEIVDEKMKEHLDDDNLTIL